METRKAFLQFVWNIGSFEDMVIDEDRFNSIHEKEYVFSILQSLMEQESPFKEILVDFRFLEQQRYTILSNSLVSNDATVQQIKKAIEFCAKSSAEKYESRFIINPNLEKYVSQSRFLWQAPFEPVLADELYSYLFIPSLVKGLEPKELFLTGFHSVLLDLMHFKEVFSFTDFHKLLEETMDMETEALKEFLIEFLEEQLLYYQTFIIAD
jgi:hypothetical protein